MHRTEIDLVQVKNILVSGKEVVKKIEEIDSLELTGPRAPIVRAELSALCVMGRYFSCSELEENLEHIINFNNLSTAV